MYGWILVAAGSNLDANIITFVIKKLKGIKLVLDLGKELERRSM